MNCLANGARKIKLLVMSSLYFLWKMRQKKRFKKVGFFCGVKVTNWFWVGIAML